MPQPPSDSDRGGLAYFAEDSSAEVVNARMGEDASPRLQQGMAALVRHLHAAVKEVEPTHQEWLAAIRFLTSGRWTIPKRPAATACKRRSGAWTGTSCWRPTDRRFNRMRPSIAPRKRHQAG
ncbi:Hydroxyquinol 1,2-dioxygenase [Sphingobium herbicidovorans NBRC 16415]|uniref:Hydroxyquinol 1,2-dioxygenase n=3 Tax=Sphingobium herbicidovorans TaxID=76947 RepID=A0A086P6I6_SPHHM|nr:putative dioxygenase [uncultured bacterium]AEV57427.1 putative dioxygenase [uncultured bacterium]KFG89004.1 Hydroxyquinol 1,2-dioxygenase [Sphingobium herbicidovorans NBRC 16415]